MMKATVLLALLSLLSLPGGAGSVPVPVPVPQEVKAAQQPATEYKVLADAGSVAAVKQLFGLSKPDKKRLIYFYDTAALDYYGRGLALRARAGDEKGDTTVKMRPAPAAIPAAVSAADGFKCEYDRTMMSSVYACSLTGQQPPAQIASAAQGALGVKKLFSETQEAWLGNMDWGSLKVLGPIKSDSWEVSHPVFEKLAFESWTLPGGPAFFEISFRFIGGQVSAEARIKAFHAELARLGIRPASDQSSKTRAAMRFFSGN